MTHISSRKNSEIQRLRRLLDDGGFRRCEGAFVCQGSVMLEEAVRSGMEIERVYCLESQLHFVPEGMPCVTVTPEIIEVISGVESASGLVFTCRIPQNRALSGNRFIALEDVRDPGNVGTVIRTADALGIDGVIMLGSCADCFAPKVVRSTMGSLFRMPLHFCTVEQLREYCTQQGISLIAAELNDTACRLGETPLASPCCVMIGNEARGLSEAAVKSADRSYIIPMQGAESLNAAVAASLFMWEMTRDGV
ncbi:MAG: RNA methyltransferase [Clostridia bacterium]|nr:RNA methyltransferase [Clostridia bacterium]